MRAGGAALGWTADQIMEKTNEMFEILDFWEDSQEAPELLEDPSEDILELENDLLIPEVEETVAVAEPPPFSPMREQVPPPPLNVASAPPQQPGPSVASLPSAAPPPQQGIAASSPENRARFAAMFPNDLASGVIRSQGIGSLV